MNILIIGKSGCRPCKDARKLARELVGKDGTYTYKDIEHADNEHLQHWMEVTGIQTVPQIFIDGEHVGGFEEFAKYVG
jgi:glutaredoxin